MSGQMGGIIRYGEIFPLINMEMVCGNDLRKNVTLWWDGEIHCSIIGFSNEIETLKAILEKYHIYGSMTTYRYTDLAGLECEITPQLTKCVDILKFIEILMQYGLISDYDYRRYERVLKSSEVEFKEYRINNKCELEIYGEYGKTFSIIIKPSLTGELHAPQAVGILLGLSSSEISREEIMKLVQRFPLVRKAFMEYLEYLRNIAKLGSAETAVSMPEAMN